MTPTPSHLEQGKRGAWHDAARVIHEARPDWSSRQIADALGVTTSAVYKVLNPDRAREYNRRENHRPGRQEQKNAWQHQRDHSEAGRKRCSNPVCQGLLGAGSARRGHEICRACFLAVAEVRRTLAEGMWADGWTLSQMGEAFGVDGRDYFPGMRVRGWDLPHRRTPEQVARIRAGRWGHNEEGNCAAWSA